MKTTAMVAVVVVVVAVGCSSGKSSSSAAGGGGGGAVSSEPIAIPKGVPDSAVIAAVVRSPWSMGDAITKSFLGPMDPTIAKELRADVVAILQSRLGVDPLGVQVVAGFVIDDGGDPAIGLVVPGVVGELRGDGGEEHAGVKLHPFEDDTVFALTGGTLYFGDPPAVRAALDAASGKGALGADSPLGKLLTGGSGGAMVAVAADAAKIPAPEFQQAVSQFGVTGASFHLGSRGLRAHVVASKDGAAKLEDMLRGGVAMANAQLDGELAKARQQTQGFEAAGQVLALHHARNAIAQVDISVDGAGLTVSLPIDGPDATMVVALIGVGAAVAIPAFMKYIKKSKTTEARQFVKKIYDGARAYHMDSGKLPASTPLTPPNPTACCEKCAPDASQWTSDAWVSLMFSVDDPHYYSYQFISDGSSTFTVRAHGDLDCDGEWSTFEMYGQVGPDGIPGSPGLYRERELE